MQYNKKQDVVARRKYYDKNTVRQIWLPNGTLSVLQHEANGFKLTYNPDDDRFYVTDDENNTLHICKDHKNASFFYKRLAGLTGKGKHSK